MLLDFQAILSNAQAITATAASTYVYNAGADGVKTPAKAYNGPIELLCQVVETFTNLTTLTIALQTDSDEAFGTAVTLGSVVVALADLVAGKTVDFNVESSDLDQYTRLYYTVAGSAPDAGKISAGFVDNLQRN